MNRRSFLALLGITPMGFHLFGRIENSKVFGKPFTTVYKVTSKDNMSMIYGYGKYHDDMSVHYEIGKVVRPKPGNLPLYVISDFDEALDYSKTNILQYSNKIYRCRTKDFYQTLGNRCDSLEPLELIYETESL